MLNEGLEHRALLFNCEWMIMEKLLEKLLDETADMARLESAVRGAVEYRELYLGEASPPTLVYKLQLADCQLRRERVDDLALYLPICERRG